MPTASRFVASNPVFAVNIIIFNPDLVKTVRTRKNCTIMIRSESSNICINIHKCACPEKLTNSLILFEKILPVKGKYEILNGGRSFDAKSAPESPRKNLTRKKKIFSFATAFLTNK